MEDINLLAVSSHKGALWRFQVDTFGNSTEKTFLVQYLNRNIRIKELEGLVKCAPIDTVGYFKLRRTLKDLKLQRKQERYDYEKIMHKLMLRAKRSCRGPGTSNWLKEFMQSPRKGKKADSPADHDMAQHPLNSDIGG